MRSRTAANEHVAEVARRRLELLSAELAGLRRDLPDSRDPGRTDGAGESREPADADADAEVAPSPTPQDHARPGRHAQRSIGVVGSIGGWVHDRLPPTLQGRVQIGASHLTVVALLVAAALAVTAWWVIRADGSGTMLPAAAPAAATGGPSALVPVPESASADSAALVSAPVASASALIVIDVVGKVRRPGIATLPVGSRVVDALKAAGGVRRGVGLRTLNLARLLVDGEQIVVGIPPPSGVAAPAASAQGAGTSAATPMVNLNTATQTELETLPGVGPVTGSAILKWRDENGAFTAVDELLEVSGIGDATLAELAPFVTL